MLGKYVSGLGKGEATDYNTFPLLPGETELERMKRIMRMTTSWNDPIENPSHGTPDAVKAIEARRQAVEQAQSGSKKKNKWLLPAVGIAGAIFAFMGMR